MRVIVLAAMKIFIKWKLNRHCSCCKSFAILARLPVLIYGAGNTRYKTLTIIHKFKTCKECTH